jgi:hypothetical protein
MRFVTTRPQGGDNMLALTRTGLRASILLRKCNAKRPHSRQSTYMY